MVKMFCEQLCLWAPSAFNRFLRLWLRVKNLISKVLFSTAFLGFCAISGFVPGAIAVHLKVGVACIRSIVRRGTDLISSEDFVSVTYLLLEI